MSRVAAPAAACRCDPLAAVSAATKASCVVQAQVERQTAARAAARAAATAGFEGSLPGGTREAHRVATMLELLASRSARWRTDELAAVTRAAIGLAEAAARRAAAVTGCLGEIAASEEAGPAGETEAVGLTGTGAERARRAAAGVASVAGQKKQAGLGRRWLAAKQVEGWRAVGLLAWAVADAGSEAACWPDPGWMEAGLAAQGLLYSWMVGSGEAEWVGALRAAVHHWVEAPQTEEVAGGSPAAAARTAARSRPPATGRRHYRRGSGRQR